MTVSKLIGYAPAILLSLWVGSTHSQGLRLETEKFPKIHRDSLGNPCLSVIGLARRHVANPDVYDQVLIIRNQCGRPIRIHACYSDSERCIDKEVPAFERQETVLGVSPMVKQFRYGLKEM